MKRLIIKMTDSPTILVLFLGLMLMMSFVGSGEEKLEVTPAETTEIFVEAKDLESTNPSATSSKR